MRILEKSALNILGTGASTALSLVAGILLARVLSPDGFGQYTLVTSSASAIAYISSLALGSAGIYFINRLEMDSIAITTMVFKLAFFLGVTIGVLVFALLEWRDYFGDIENWARLAVSIFAAAILITAVLDQILLAFFDIRAYIAVRLAPTIVLVILLVFALLLPSAPILTPGSAWIYTALGQVVGAALLIWFLRSWVRPSLGAAISEYFAITRYGISLSLAFAVNLLHGELGLLLLRYFSEDFEEIGFYRVAVRLGSVLLLLAGAITPLLYAKWSGEEGQRRRDQVERVSRVFWLGIVVAIVALELISAPLVRILYGPEYEPAIRVFRVLLLGVACRALISPLIQLFAGGGKPLITTFILTINLVLLAVLIALWAPTNGAFGAAVAFVVSSAAALVMAYGVAARSFDVRIRYCFFATREDLGYIWGTVANLAGRIGRR